ncbi:DUF624 domain-containing protein [Xylanimonas protaetiae]|uniref:DUF624 domain-containing protein n=1 Tax=Xylanimonas protaetiae TaxID=2509457 RepID=A0A4P6F2N0_9MICO|nr:DUF624 domain-containing protein [Xylanimonas protaetiae]QAY68983.1 DUF624 domain-containing protein [Xylanimonas protaetiae]
MTTNEQPVPARNPFEPLERSPHKPVPGEPTEGFLSKATRAIYWYIVLTALLVVACLPTIVLGMFLPPDPSNIPLIALTGLFVGPALSAGLYTVRARYTDLDLAPARAFWRGYRLNWADVLKLWVPAMVVLGIIGFTLAFGAEAGIGPMYRIALLVIAVVGLIWALHAVAIATFFNFRTGDIARLAVYYMAFSVKSTFGVVAMAIVAIGIVAWASAALLGVVGGVWVWFWYQIDKPCFVDIWNRFTAKEPAE